ncbi:homeobox protein VENTX [Pyxicephalus adspersus]|uniref:homeobox protein VENTX n=1 Tax=Pyxicephalus adspersus TaxID=30357 RepID=UPI003B58CFF8
MERRFASVEWLSESSQRNATHPNVDLLACRSSTSALQNLKEVSIQGMDRPSSATSNNEKENCIDHTAAQYQVEKTQTETHDMAMLRKPFKEIRLCTPSPSSEHQNSDTDSTRSPGSLSEEEATSRSRTRFTKEQMQELEKSFMENRYIGSNEKKRLSKVLKLSETQIKTWFQNRRMKFKRQSQDARVEAFFSGLYVPYYGYSNLQTPTCPVRPELAIPLASPASAPHVGPHSSTVIRPYLPSSTPPTNLGSYPYPFFVQPSFRDSAGPRYSPY